MDMAQHICTKDMIQPSHDVEMVQHVFTSHEYQTYFEQNVCIQRIYVVQNRRARVFARVSLKSMVTDDWFAVQIVGWLELR